MDLVDLRRSSPSCCSIRRPVLRAPSRHRHRHALRGHAVSPLPHRELRTTCHPLSRTSRGASCVPLVLLRRGRRDELGDRHRARDVLYRLSGLPLLRWVRGPDRARGAAADRWLVDRAGGRCPGPFRHGRRAVPMGRRPGLRYPDARHDLDQPDKSLRPGPVLRGSHRRPDGSLDPRPTPCPGNWLLFALLVGGSAGAKASLVPMLIVGLIVVIGGVAISRPSSCGRRWRRSRSPLSPSAWPRVVLFRGNTGGLVIGPDALRFLPVVTLTGGGHSSSAQRRGTSLLDGPAGGAGVLVVPVGGRLRAPRPTDRHDRGSAGPAF